MLLIHAGVSFHVLLDNTAADNKNNVVLFFLAWLVLRNYTIESRMFCMVKGHTYSRIDQCFRTLIGHCLSAAVNTCKQLVDSIFEFLGAYNCTGCHELHCLWDWSSYFAPHVHERFAGFGPGQYGSGMHEFVFRKDSDGVVRMWYRKSSQSTTWFPDGDGMPVFRSSPEGKPELKKAKPDASWRRAEVESTVRAWFRWMSVQASELVRIKQEWETCFANLPPPDGDTSFMPHGLQLEWVDLPEHEPSRCSNPVRPRITGTVENPPVNPVTGVGRTAADVQAELRAYQDSIRAVSDVSVFQADFLFVKAEVAGKRTHEHA